MYYDIESQELVTLAQLEQEYKERITSGEIDETQTFIDYVENSLTRNNGTLELITK